MKFSLSTLCFLLFLILGIPLVVGRALTSDSLPAPTASPTALMITGDTTWTGLDRTIPTALEIPPNTALKIEPGATITFAPSASLIIRGTLEAVGTPDHPIIFLASPATSAQWGGLQFQSESKGTIAYAQFFSATPAIACQKDSQLIAYHLNIKNSLLGLYTESSDCSIKDSTLEQVHNGVITRGIPDSLDTLTIESLRDPIRSFLMP